MEEINKQLNQEEYLEYIEQWKLENKDLIKSGKCRKVFLENLPLWNIKRIFGKINWKESIEYKIYFIYENMNGFIKIIDYKLNNSVSMIKLKFNNKEHFVTAYDLKNYRIEKIINKRTLDFKLDIGTILQDNSRNMTIINSEYRKKTYIKPNKVENNCNQKWYNYHCNICHYEGWIVESALLTQKQGCSCCSNMTIVKGYNDIATTDSWMTEWLDDKEDAYKYSNSTHKKIYFKCKECGYRKKMAIYVFYKTHSISCPNCSDGISMPNKIMYYLLKQLNINFEREYSPEWINQRAYDFYIPSMNSIIEMDGGLGHGKKVHALSGQTAKESKAIDDYKDEQAEIHGIEKPIRIDCDYGNNDRFEYIKQSILDNEKINELFDLSMIDWLTIEEKSYNSLVKIICEIKKDNPNLTTTEIGEKMSLSRSVVLKYLKLGNKIWDWCKYIPKEELKKSSSKNGKSTGIPLVCISTGDIFESLADCERKSEELFGVKLLNGEISAICLNKRSQYKGFTFKYIKDLTESEYKLYDIENKLKELEKSA